MLQRHLNILNLPCFLLTFLLISISGYGQWKNYQLTAKGDTLNRVDMSDKKQGPHLIRLESLRGEPGYEEEGYFIDSRKEGVWRRYTLMGDILSIENYKWGNKDGKCQYFTALGDLLREENWRAMNPDQLYDTIEVVNPERPTEFKKKVIKNEGHSLKHGTWKLYDPGSGELIKTENWWYDELRQDAGIEVVRVKPATKNTTPTIIDDKPQFANNPSQKKPLTAEEKKKLAKPAEVMAFEKANSGKKKVKVRDGQTF